MSVDLPEPETPVTHTNRPTGSARSIFLRLFPRAPRSRNTRVLSKRRRASGSAISSAPERYWPVREAGFLRICSGGPSATTRPPCSPAPLRLAARERVRGAVERQIVEADVVEEAEPRNDLVDDFLGDGLLAAFELELAEEFERLLQWEPAHFVNGALADPDVARLQAQPRSLARGAGLGVPVFRELLAHHERVRFLVATLEAGQDALEGVLLHDGAAALAQVGERDFLPCALEHERLDRLGQVFERRFDVEPEMRREAREHLEIELVAPVPAFDRAARQAQARVS